MQVNSTLLEINSVILAGIPMQILERRPDVLAAHWRFNSAFYRVGEAKAARISKLSLTGGVGVVTSQLIILRSEFINPVISLCGDLVAISMGSSVIVKARPLAAMRKMFFYVFK